MEYEILKSFTVADIYAERVASDGEFDEWFLKLLKEGSIQLPWRSIEAIGESVVLCEQLEWLEDKGFIGKIDTFLRVGMVVSNGDIQYKLIVDGYSDHFYFLRGNTCWTYDGEIKKGMYLSDLNKNSFPIIYKVVVDD